MKKMILTPDWVLEKIPLGWNVDFNGVVSAYTLSIADANFIELALNTLEIQFEQEMNYSDENDELSIEFYFRLEDIRNDCPSFYEFMIDDFNNLGWNLSKN